MLFNAYYCSDHPAKRGPFIVEWVPHMGAIGVTDLLVYTNDCDDVTDALLAVLAKHGALHHIMQ